MLLERPPSTPPERNKRCGSSRQQQQQQQHKVCVDWQGDDKTTRIRTPNKHWCHAWWKQRLMYQDHFFLLFCEEPTPNVCMTHAIYITSRQSFWKFANIFMETEPLQIWVCNSFKNQALPAISVRCSDSRTLRFSRTRRDTGLWRARHEITTFCNDCTLGILVGQNTASSHH